MIITIVIIITMMMIIMIIIYDLARWEFFGDRGWCGYDAAASRQLEAAHLRGEDAFTVRSGAHSYVVDLRGVYI